jgi:hypothetical protein
MDLKGVAMVKTPIVEEEKKVEHTAESEGRLETIPTPCQMKIQYIFLVEKSAPSLHGLARWVSVILMTLGATHI